MMRGVRLAAVVAAQIGLLVFGTVATPALGRADSCADAGTAAPLPLDRGACADVLAQEARWLTAITAGDRATVDAILSPTYKHITNRGVLMDRAQEIDTTVPQTSTMNATDQRVDIAGDSATIHGINTVTQAGRVLDTVRFTDVFILQNGMWLALSAQETTI